jgi:hypothetical protein
MGVALVALFGPMGTAGANTHSTFSFAPTQVTFTVPVPSCRTVRNASACEWMLFVDEHGATGPPVVIGEVIGTSGDLVFHYPSFCGAIQIDALVGTPGHWRKVVGHQRTIATCAPPRSIHAPTQASVLSTGRPTGSTTGEPGGSALPSLAFTGIGAGYLLVGGLSLMGLGVVLMGRRLLVWLFGD